MDKQLVYVEVSKIKPDPLQPRKFFDAASIERLAESIKTEGLINPVEISPDYMIITGERRFKACQLLNLKKIPVIINSQDFDEYTRLRHQISENIQQASMGGGDSMSPIDTAKAYKKLLDMKLGKPYEAASVSPQEMYGKAKEVYTELGVSERSFWFFLKLLEQPEFVQKDIESGRPRTYYDRANTLNDEYTKEVLQKNIAEGKYGSREELDRDIVLVKRFPENIELLKAQHTQNKQTSLLLNAIVRLALCMDRTPLDKIDAKEIDIVTNQLKWVQGELIKYLNGGED